MAKQEKPILLALQYSKFDYELAMKLAELIADMQLTPCDCAGIMLSHTQNAPLPPKRIIDKLKAVFLNVHIYRCVNFATGWPAGCNQQAHDTYSHFFMECRSGKMDYAAVFLFEPDSVPLNRGWVTQIHKEWHNCDWDWPLGDKQHCLGAWYTQKDGCKHINGNMLISRDFLRVYREFRSSGPAWDCAHKDATMRHGRPSKLIASDYHLDTPRNPWKGADYLWRVREYADDNPLHGKGQVPAFLHGCKTDRAIQCVRAKYGLSFPASSPS
jgi:hypothetical protein